SCGVCPVFSAMLIWILASLYPAPRLMMIGIGLLTFGSFVGLFSHHYWMVILGRMIQGMGAGAFPSVRMVMAAKFYPLEKRGFIIGIIMSSITFGAGFGPLVGGYLTHLLGWRVLFEIGRASCRERV